MKYINLGNTGLKVSEVCLGTWQLPRSKEKDQYGIRRVDIEETRKVVALAFDNGVNFIDTANRYSGAMITSDLHHVGNVEKILGEILREYHRESYVIATKVGIQMGPWVNGDGLSRKHIFWQIGESLKRLQLEYVDVYLAHSPDEETPHLETLHAFDDLVHLGKAHYLGSSNFLEEQVMDFMELSQEHGLTGFATLQEPYSLVDRAIEQSKIPIARKYNLSIMAYSPLAQGILSGKYLSGIPEGSRATYSQNLRRAISERSLVGLGELSRLAEEKGISLSQLAIAWVLRKQKALGVNVIPIIGVSSSEQLLENLQAVEVQLSEDEIASAEQIAATVKVHDILRG